jgi:pimeloyl-ACP methyl ester carboxylesterase
LRSPPATTELAATPARREVVANGLRIAYLEAGAGPLVLLLHGYPDDAWSWEHQFQAMVDAGYRVVAPFLRGYPPTEIPANGFYDRATLANDVKGLIEALNGGSPVYLVAQDWGAAIAWGVLGAYPELVRRAVILAVPHPVEIRRTLRSSPRHAVRSFHWFLFQLPWLPERICRAFGFAFIGFLWWLWSPRFDDHAHVTRIKRMMAVPGVVEATLGYYRAAFGNRHRDPALAELMPLLDRPTPVPVLAVCGSRDMRRELLPRQRDLLAGPYSWTLVEHAGHFLHREKSIRINRLVLEFLAQDAMREHA